jgi:hypothetical protein
MALFLLRFTGSTLATEHVLPALDFTEYDGLIIRLYGIFQLSWALLFFFSLKDVEKKYQEFHFVSRRSCPVLIFHVKYLLSKYLVMRLNK